MLKKISAFILAFVMTALAFNVVAFAAIDDIEVRLSGRLDSVNQVGGKPTYVLDFQVKMRPGIITGSPMAVTYAINNTVLKPVPYAGGETALSLTTEFDGGPTNNNYALGVSAPNISAVSQSTSQSLLEGIASGSTTYLRSTVFYPGGATFSFADWQTVQSVRFAFVGAKNFADLSVSDVTIPSKSAFYDTVYGGAHTFVGSSYIYGPHDEYGSEIYPDTMGAPTVVMELPTPASDSDIEIRLFGRYDTVNRINGQPTLILDFQVKMKSGVITGSPMAVTYAINNTVLKPVPYAGGETALSLTTEFDGGPTNNNYALGVSAPNISAVSQSTSQSLLEGIASGSTTYLRSTVFYPGGATFSFADWQTVQSVRFAFVGTNSPTTLNVSNVSIPSKTMFYTFIYGGAHTFAGASYIYGPHDEYGAETYPDTMDAPTVVLPEPPIATGFTYTYYKNSGTWANTGWSDPYTVDYDDADTPALELGSVVTRQYYSFAGWFDNTTAGSQITTAAKANTTLYARWTPKDYTINYVGDGTYGDTTKAFSGSDITVTSGVASSAAVQSATRDHYTFNGWYNSTNKVEYLHQAADLIDAGSGNSITLTSSWTPITYTLVYNDTLPGSAPSGTTFTAETTSFTPAAQVTNSSTTGQTPTGWYTAASGGTKVDDITKLLAWALGKTTVNLYGQWSEDSYTVTYNVNSKGAAPSPNPATITAANFATAFKNPTDDGTSVGYSFGGWYADNGVWAEPIAAFADIAGKATAGALEVFAKWNPITVTVNYNTNGHGTAPGPTPITFTWGAFPYTLATMAPDGPFTFVCWTYGSSDTDLGTTIDEAALKLILGSPATLSANTSINLKAKWTEDEIVISYIDTKGTAPGAETKLATATGTITAAPAATTASKHYAFPGTTGGWYLAVNNGTEMVPDWAASATKVTTYEAAIAAAVAKKVTLIAVWEPIVYTINFTDSMGGTPSKTSETFTIETTGTLNGLATSSGVSGLTFVGWTEVSETLPVLSISDAADLAYATGSVTVYAYWSANTYTVTFNANGKGSVTGVGPITATAGVDSGVYKPTDDATSFGYKFAGWYFETACTTPIVTQADVIAKATGDSGVYALTVYAKWVPVTITVVYDSNGHLSDPANGSFAYSALPFTPATMGNDGSYTFGGWTYGVAPGTLISGNITELLLKTILGSPVTLSDDDSITLTAKWNYSASPTITAASITQAGTLVNLPNSTLSFTVNDDGVSGLTVKIGYKRPGMGSYSYLTPNPTFTTGAPEIVSLAAIFASTPPPAGDYFLIVELYNGALRIDSTEVSIPGAAALKITAPEKPTIGLAVDQTLETATLTPSANVGTNTVKIRIVPTSGPEDIQVVAAPYDPYDLSGLAAGSYQIYALIVSDEDGTTVLATAGPRTFTKIEAITFDLYVVVNTKSVKTLSTGQFELLVYDAATFDLVTLPGAQMDSRIEITSSKPSVITIHRDDARGMWTYTAGATGSSTITVLVNGQPTDVAVVTVVK